jgi:anti-sigma factor RsiW
METCPYSLQISNYHDGELSVEQRGALEQHLAAGCAPCQTELSQWTRLSMILASGPSPRLSDQAREALYRLAPVVSEAAFVRVAKWAIGLAASVLVAVSGWMMMINHKTATPMVVVSPQQTWVQVALNPNQSLDTVADAGSDAQYSDWVVNNLGSSGSHD